MDFEIGIVEEVEMVIVTVDTTPEPVPERRGGRLGWVVGVVVEFHKKKGRWSGWGW